MEVSDRVIVMAKGKIEQDATPREVYHKPATPFVAAFVGDVNRVEGIVRSGAVVWGFFRFEAPGLAEGARAQVLFRPSDVYVSNEPGDGRNHAVIRSSQFFGAFESLEIDAHDGRFLTAHVPTWAARARGLVAGKEVYVFVTSKPRVYPAENETVLLAP